MNPSEDVAGQVTSRLTALGALDVLAGGALAVAGRTPAQRAFGQQTAAWGAVDLVIAAVGRLRPPADAARLRRVLLVNAGLDLLYVAAGAHVAYRTPDLGGRLGPEQARGHGAAVVLQGLALLALDTTYARRL